MKERFYEFNEEFYSLEDYEEKWNEYYKSMRKKDVFLEAYDELKRNGNASLDFDDWYENYEYVGDYNITVYPTGFTNGDTESISLCIEFGGNTLSLGTLCSVKFH